ncbi:hypothetical protein OEZ85_003550 [Tetradesmus obliquus]|uniref:YqaJ viral recombinase domain-containing protein n=1 Tax=Tetradesmus obliquus TaxID=3088 RepID=A0ABY8UBN4_TETOB|nr:hypothetical protein OEZ85_003550 [Tetradesmus obliquus]
MLGLSRRLLPRVHPAWLLRSYAHSGAEAAGSSSNGFRSSWNPGLVKDCLDVLITSINVEASNGYPDTKGRSGTFSQFANLSLSTVADNAAALDAAAAASGTVSSAPGLQQQLRQLAQQMGGYGALEVQQRQHLLQHLQAQLLPQQAAAVRPKVDEAGSQVDQRTDAWLSLREGRLTGSALCAVLDWFRGKGKTSEAARLWLQKLKLAPPTAANEAMAYGTHSEPLAMAAYQGLAPHEQLTALGLRVWRDDEVHGWLAASPDGLITVGTANGAAGLSAAEADWLRQQAGVSGEGVLEIKCPHKALKGKLPAPQEYYMPQVQCLFLREGFVNREDDTLLAMLC